jgi:hypothetical protein
MILKFGDEILSCTSIITTQLKADTHLYCRVAGVLPDKYEKVVVCVARLADVMVFSRWSIQDGLGLELYWIVSITSKPTLPGASFSNVMGADVLGWILLVGECI